MNLYPYSNFHDMNLDWIINEVKKAINEWLQMQEIFKGLKDDFEELKTYVQDYFKNLNVQEEINNKIDDMIADGTLEEIFSTYINIPLTFKTTNEAISKSFTLGTYIVTLGYSSEGDGGGAQFIVSDSGFDTLKLANNNYLKPVSNVHDANVYGCDYTGAKDCSSIVNKILSDTKKVIFGNGIYKIEHTINISRGMAVQGTNKHEYETFLDFSACLDDVLFNVSEYNISFRDINIKGNYQKNTVDAVRGFYLKNASYVDLFNCNTYYVYNGFTLEHSWCCSLRNCNARFGDSAFRLIGLEKQISTNNYLCKCFAFNQTTNGFFASGITRALIESSGTDTCTTGFYSNATQPFINFVSSSFEISSQYCINIGSQIEGGQVNFIGCWFPYNNMDVKFKFENYKALSSTKFSNCDLSTLNSVEKVDGLEINCVQCNIKSPYFDGSDSYGNPSLFYDGKRYYATCKGLIDASKTLTIKFLSNDGIGAYGYVIRPAGVTKLEMINGEIDSASTTFFSYDKDKKELKFTPSGGVLEMFFGIVGNIEV